MKIYCITMKLSGGSGHENDLLYRTLQSLGNQVVVITTFSKYNKIPNLPYQVIEENFRNGKLLNLQYNVLKLLFKYSKEADAFHVDGHAFLYGAGTYRLLGGKTPVAAFFNRELTAWPENVSAYLAKAEAKPFKKRMKQWLRFNIESYLMTPLANYIDLFEFTNPFLEKSYNEFGLKTQGRSLTIGDLYDWPALWKQYSLTEQSYSRRNKMAGPLNILHIGRMVPGKGFDLLITAFSKVINKENFRVVLVGDGPEEEPLKELTRHLGVEKYFAFAGYQPLPNLYKIFLQTDIFIQPRWRHDLTTMSLEIAMAFGIPNIIPGGGGLSWVAGKGALYFKDNDPEDLAKKIEQLGNDPSLRTKISSQCYKRLKEDELNYKNRVELIYQKLKCLTNKP